ncbi:3',5'-nucleoside bisphosphate phosphatase [Azospira inquinata]|uniref:PHP domain-containing protein n=1 Tax=Azospira inquinata TaxID=2785627 RepID=A0A975SMM2_9RHOO|nr:3',5'-nucleoside bisphosphate phosphatase [Azospira inquinata]QWT45526.1 PHP domain-containing protein [Azospira inquinata]QWT49146.1 PHP domain-containing protein [Azospira inquinata]
MATLASPWDLHCHSTASDGLLAPEAVVRRAQGNGVTVLALTDHDDLDGLAAAEKTAGDVGIRLINGVEISIQWESTSIHIVGLGFDRQEARLNQGLAAIRSGRVTRAQRMAEALDKIGIHGVLEGAMKYAANPSLISRAHFARYLVEIGICKDVHAVFESYLTPGKPGYVEHQWASLEDAVTWINGAGGVAVVAHPGRYRISNVEMRRFLGQFKDVGGSGVEVVSGSHTPDQILQYARYARQYGFLASLGSDFHGPEESYVDLGRIGPLPEDLIPVWTWFD